MDPWVWAAVLLAAGFALAVLDVFLPSGGMFAVLAVIAIIAAIYLGFTSSVVAGFAILAAAMLGVPVVLFLALQLLPKTRLGRRVLLEAPTSEEVLPDAAQRRDLQKLVGRTGKAKTRMLPNGIILVDGRSLDAISDGFPVEPGQAVRIVEIRGNRIVVEGLRDQPAASAEDVLSQPIDWDDDPGPPERPAS